jgi:hypothetical protein
MPDNQLQPDPIVRLYNNIKNEYDLPDFNTFKADMSDSNKAKRLHATLISDGYDVPNYDVFSVDMGLKKKAGNSASLGILSPSPKETNFLQQGQNVASGQIFTDISKSVPKTTLKEAAVKDKDNNNSYLGAVWNNVVSSAERLAGGAARLAMKMDTGPVSMIQNAVDKAASSVTGINYQAQREKETTKKFKDFIGKARSSASSKEYEQGLAKGFDITNGIGLDDIKGLGVVLPSMLADMAIAVPTAGVSFGIQGYDDALSTLDDTPEGKYMSETTRTAFGLGGGIIAGVLEKLGMDNILKSGTATKYVTSKILQETAGELAKKGVKVTAEQFEKAVANKATQMLTKTALKNTVKAGAKSAFGEGFTEATQEGAMDLLKLASNQLEGKKIFDEEDLKNTAASRYLNAAAMGGIFGGVSGAVMSRTKNVQRHIENEVKNATTQEDINNILNDINQNVKDGVISKNDAEVFKSMVDDNVSKPSSLDIENEKNVKLSDIDQQISSLNKEDRLYNQNLDKLTKERNETNSYYDGISKQSQKNEEVAPDDGKPAPMEENKSLDDELRRAFNYSVYEEGVNSGDEWVREDSKKFLADPKKYIESKIELAKEVLSSDPNNDSAKMLLEDNADRLRVFNEITNKYKQNVVQKEAIPAEVKITDDIEAQKSEIERRREVEVNDLPNRGIVREGLAITTSKEFDKIKDKYDAELATLESGNLKVKPTEAKAVEQLRAEEQAELDSKIPNAEQYRVDGKVDRAKLINEEDIKAFDKVYEKYDELITPLLEEQKQGVRPIELKAKEEKTFAQKDLDRAEAKKIHGRVSEMEPPSDAAQVALRYLAENGKVSQDAINEVSGTTKGPSLNTGRRELKTAEVKARDYAEGNESLNDLAHRLWELNGQRISERDIKDALMSEIGNNNTRLDASKAYLERYNPEYQQEQYYNRLAEERQEEFLKEQDELERQLRKPLDEQIEGEASEEYINNLIKQYEAEFERENKQLEPESKGKAIKEVSGRDGGKEVKEKSIEQAYKDLTRNEKRQIINSKFDELVKELKIEKLCPT